MRRSIRPTRWALAAVLLSVLGALAVTGSSAGHGLQASLWKPPRLQNTWSGTWSTDWGTMTITQSGGSFEASYTHDSGHVSGRLNGSALTVSPRTGYVMTGRWNEAPTRKGPNDAGAVILTIAREGRSFTGKWNYDGSQGWRTNWSGTCTSGDCLLNEAAVPVAAVSNGCGGEGWDSVVAIENYIGNTSTYKNSNINPLAKSYTVSFVDACNLHDAGYSGAIVPDKLHGGALVDFRNWSRLAVDKKFLEDMRLLCERQIPATATVALTNCKARGGTLSFGAESRYNAVRRVGSAFFDADLTKAGTQATGERTND